MDDGSAQQVVASDPRLYDTVNTSLAGVKLQDKSVCIRCAAELSANGYLTTLENTAPPVGVSRKKVIKEARKRAMAKLKEANALPTGFGGWLQIMFVILPFLTRFLQSWLYDD
jgi:hypothetical protein